MKQQKDQDYHLKNLDGKSNKLVLINILMFNNRIIKALNSLQTTTKRIETI
jgi:hypothetical protein